MLQKTSKKIQNRAFSLMELLISIAVFGIILFVIVPSISDFIEKNRSFSKVQQIATAIAMARNEAINCGQNIIFCPSDDGIVCKGIWNSGQLIIDAEGHVIRIFDEVHNGDFLSWKSSLSEDKNNYLEFLPTGETNGQQGSFYYCPNKNPKNAYSIIIQQSGFFRISDKTADGKDIVCS